MDENYVYVALQTGGDINIIQSGSCDFMETENPLKSVYLRLKKDGDITSRIGFKISTFQGSGFYVKISE